mmetsp:Transcript_9184/g.14893  ORF Transcript_9184/g.14893 Transcript_9184/m.14893 type:complete len:111 (+) Transcript_9184:391-723(+)
MRKLNRRYRNLVKKIALNASRTVENRPGVAASKWALRKVSSDAVDIAEKNFTEYIRKWLHFTLDEAAHEAAYIAEDRKITYKACRQIVHHEIVGPVYQFILLDDDDDDDD